MKSKHKVMIVVLIVVISVITLLFNAIYVQLPRNTIVTLNYEYCGEVIHEKLTSEESEAIISILNGKVQFFDNPSCGFDKKINLSVNNQSFLLACDGCPTIKHGLRYFNVEEGEIKIIHSIMEKYGATFPCV